MGRVVLVSTVVMLAAVAGCSPAPRTPITMPSLPGSPSVAPSPSPSPSPSPAVSPSPVPSPAASSQGSRYTFPVAGNPVSYHRTHSAYPATDIFANCGSPVRAVTDGVVLEVSRVDRFDSASPDNALKGGLFVSIKGDDGVRYYGAHLTRVEDGVDAGVRVSNGQTIGTVGRTGNASNVCHLHFGISPPCAGKGDWWIRRGVVWPWSYLDSWRGKGHKSPRVEVTEWHAKHGCPKQP